MSKQTRKPQRVRTASKKKLPAPKKVRTVVRKQPEQTGPAPSEKRQLRKDERRILRLWKRTQHPVRLSSAFTITRRSTSLLWQHRVLFISLTLIYGVLNLVLVRGLAGSTNVSELKSSLESVFSGHYSSLASSFGVFIVLLGSSGNNSSNTAGAYQLFLALITSLAVIWTLRQLLAGTQIRIRDAFYKGMHPLIPFILVLLLIGVQLIPLLLGTIVYGLALSTNIAVNSFEQVLFLLMFIALIVWTVYMLSSSLFALYIVTLPDMTPMKSLRSAHELVRFRRWSVLRKILWLPLMLLVGAAVIMVPIIILVAPLAQWIFFLLTMFGLVAIHTYMYTLYRELLNE